MRLSSPSAALLLAALAPPGAVSFLAPAAPKATHRPRWGRRPGGGMPPGRRTKATAPSTRLLFSSVPSDVTEPFSAATVDALKAELVQACTRQPASSSSSSGPTLDEIQRMVRDLEDAGERMGIGQASSLTGFLSGEWELLWAPTDVTRSSPFFWAFEQAFPDQADQIFGITDSIPAPFKEVGPATQTIELSEGGTSGRLVSRVRVATLNGMATSMMTTRAEITGTVGVDGLKVRVDTTKPEDSTAVTALLPGPLGALVNDNLPPFPSGQALERAVPGSSTVVMRTTFCDDGLRISRNDARSQEPFIWRRLKFLRAESL